MNTPTHRTPKPIIINEDALSVDEVPPSTQPHRRLRPARLHSDVHDSTPYHGPNLITLQMYAKCPVLKII
ncbi:MAG: hypothetical protein JXX29_00085 [Deltaproteobacteria bacterium]|nr:hypothetical protein [Deltaproteobacteria bacterium]MBN2670034.1 hypothetical protein [Deltaproteobacteria bacterium]